MSTVFSGVEKRRMVWAWHVAGTGGRCRLLWKLDDVGARIWSESHELDLERIDGTDEVKTVALRQAQGRPLANPQRRTFETPAQVRRFPRR
jgi:hypothetical protein